MKKYYTYADLKFFEYDFETGKINRNSEMPFSHFSSGITYDSFMEKARKIPHLTVNDCGAIHYYCDSYLLGKWDVSDLSSDKEHILYQYVDVNGIDAPYNEEGKAAETYAAVFTLKEI